MDYNSPVLRGSWGFDSLRGYVGKVMKEQSKNLEISSQGSLDKADKIKNRNIELWVRRNITNEITGERSPGKLERGWRILNIDSGGLATVYNMSSNETFHIPLGELENINQTIFDSIE